MRDQVYKYVSVLLDSPWGVETFRVMQTARGMIGLPSKKR